MKSFLKAAIFLAAVGCGIWFLTKLKADQVKSGPPGSVDVGPSVPDWKWGTTDPRLQGAIEANDGAEVRRLLKLVPQSAIRPVAAQIVADNHFHSCLGPFLEAGWSPDGPKSDGAPLFTAITNGDLETCRILLGHGANPKLPNPLEGRLRGKPVILVACAIQERGLPGTLASNDPPDRRFEICQILLQHGVDPMGAYVGDDYRLAKLFLDHGADPNKGQKLVDTAIQWDAKKRKFVARQDAARIISLLFAHGAKPDVEGIGAMALENDNERVTGTALFFYAAHSRADCVKLLLAHDADPLKKASTGQTPLDVATGECRELLLRAVARRKK